MNRVDAQQYYSLFESRMAASHPILGKQPQFSASITTKTKTASSPGCNTSTYYMHFSNSTDKLSFASLVSTPDGNFLAALNDSTAGGNAASVLIKLDLAGNIIAQRKLIVENQETAVFTVTVSHEGNILVAGKIKSQKKVFASCLYPDLSSRWTRNFAFNSNVEEIKSSFTTESNAALAIREADHTILLHLNGNSGGTLWNHSLNPMGLTNLVGFGSMNFYYLGLVFNARQGGKDVIQAIQFNGQDGTTMNSAVINAAGDRICLSSTYYSGRLMLYQAEPAGNYVLPVRDILFSPEAVETRHVYTPEANTSKDITGAMDASGDAMGMYLPASGKLVFTFQHADYFYRASTGAEYNVPAGGSIAGLARGFDGGFLFALNSPTGPVLLKTDSTGVIAGCGYKAIVPVAREQLNLQNTIADIQVTGAIVSSNSSMVSLQNSDLQQSFSCRQNFCPVVSGDETCLKTYYKTLKSPSYADKFVDFFKMDNGNFLVSTVRYERTYGDNNQMTYGLKLLDEAGHFIKGADIYSNGISNSTSCFRMDGKSVMLVTPTSINNRLQLSFTLVNDQLQKQWTRTVLTYTGWEFASSSIGDVIMDNAGNFYYATVSLGFSEQPMLLIYKMDPTGKQLWLKIHHIAAGIFNSVQLVATAGSIVAFIEGSSANGGNVTARVDRQTGQMQEAFSWQGASKGYIYRRLAALDGNYIAYAGNDNNDHLEIGIFDTTGRPRKLGVLTDVYGSTLRTGTAGNGNLYASYIFYSGNTGVEGLIKTDSNLQVKFHKKYTLERARYPAGMALDAAGNAYIAGNFSVAGLNIYDPYIIKQDSLGQRGECDGVQNDFPLTIIDPQTTMLTFSPVEKILGTADVNVQLIEDDRGHNISSIVCSTGGGCNMLDVTGPDKLCTTGIDVNYSYVKDADCHKMPALRFDTSIVSLQKMTDSSFVLRFKKAGSVTIYASVSTDCHAAQDSIITRIIPVPENFTLGPDRWLCPGEKITLHAGSSFAQYQWQDGTTDSVLQVHDAGIYSIAVESTCGQSFVDSVKVGNVIVPTVDLGDDQTICRGDSVHFAVASGFAAYQWFAGGRPISGKAEVTITPITSSQVFLNAATAEGCRMEDSVFIDLMYPTQIQLRADTSLCAGGNVLLDAGSGFVSYEWNTGSTSQTLTVNIQGNYQVTALDSNGCYARDTFKITEVYPLPIVMPGKDGSLCEGQTRRLDGGDFQSWLWEDGSRERYHVVSAPGSYTVEVTDLHKCKNTGQVNVGPLLTRPQGFLKAVDSICAYDRLDIWPMGNYNSYQWSDGSKSPLLTVHQPGTYILMVTDNNGCIGSDTIVVFDKSCLTDVFIPSAFTPNSDGRNDVFRARVFGKIDQFLLQVYNRFGQMVFSSSNPALGWDGKFKGQTVDTGTFVWFCRYQLAGEPDVVKKGTIVLVR